MCLGIIIRCHFLFILLLQQHYVFRCWRIRLVSSGYLSFISEISPRPFICAYPFKTKYFSSVYCVPRDATYWGCCSNQGRDGCSSRGAFSLVFQSPHHAVILVLAHHVMRPRLSDLPQPMVHPFHTGLALFCYYAVPHRA